MLLWLPPPHETIVMVPIARSSSEAPRTICLLCTKRTMEKNIPTASVVKEYERWCRRAADVGAVVVTVTVAVTVEAAVGFTDAGENEHVDSEGNPEQASVMVPVKFDELEMATEVVPELPRVLMNTLG